jgi:hypothetical protein
LTRKENPVSRVSRLTLAAGLIAVTVVAGACSSSGGSDPTGAPLPTAVPSLPKQLPKHSAGVAVLMQHGLRTTGSAQFTVSAKSGGVPVKGKGAATMVNGRVTGLDLTADIGRLHGVHVLVVNSVTYAQLPEPARPGKPWSPVPRSGGSHNLRTVRAAIAATEQLLAPGNVLALVKSGRTVLRGSGMAVGVPAARYAVTTAVRKLPAKAPIRGALVRQHVSSARLGLWIDGSGRPLVARTRVAPKSAVSGVVRLHSYNKSVKLQAPDPKLIAHAH